MGSHGQTKGGFSSHRVIHLYFGRGEGSRGGGEHREGVGGSFVGVGGSGAVFGGNVGRSSQIKDVDQFC